MHDEQIVGFYLGNIRQISDMITAPPDAKLKFHINFNSAKKRLFLGNWPSF